MKVFMSWSGQRSKATAELLHYWVKCVVQASQPWISTRGIDRGALWFSEINNELKDTTFGIICLTQENKSAPWILFEAGALAKGLASNRVCTFLVDLETKDIRDPLAQFNHTLPNKEGLWNLVLTLNSNLEAQRLELRILEGVFETYWPQFEAQFKKILDDIPAVTVVPPRAENDMLVEILESTRNLSQRMRLIENKESISAGRFLKSAKTSSLDSLFISHLDHFPPKYTDKDLLIAACTLLRYGKSIDEIRDALSTVPGISVKQTEEILRSLLANNAASDSGEKPKE